MNKKIAPIDNSLPKPTTLSPIINIDSQEIQQSECLSDDPETENYNDNQGENQNDETEYFQEKSEGQRHIQGLQVIDKEDQGVEHVGERKCRWDSARDDGRDGDDDEEESRDQLHIAVEVDLNCRKSAGKEDKVQMANRRKKRYPTGESEQSNTIQISSNSDNPMIQSSSSSMFSSKAPIQPLKRPPTLPKLSKKQSFTSTSSQLQDSRNNPEAPSPEQPCFEVSTQRIITFLLIYQIVLTYCTCISLIEEKYPTMLAILVLVLPTYFGARCISVASRGEPSGEELGDSADLQIIARQQSKKIFNSYYEEEKMEGRGGFKKISGENTSPTHPHKEHQSRLSFLSPEPQPRKYLLIVPYLQGGQVQQIAQCPKCPTSHTNTRVKHCPRCGECHYGYDHYCLWLAVCVDGRNYGYFLTFVLLLWGVGLLGLAADAGLALRWARAGLDKSKYFSFGVWCFSALQALFGFIFCSYVLIYHIWLTRKGISTRQHFSHISSNPNNPLFLKSLTHRVPTDYSSYFLYDLPMQLRENQLELEASSLKTMEEEERLG